MGLKLERGLKHQTEAINSINSVFENVEINNNTYKYANPIINLSSPELKNNIKKLNSKLPYSMRKNVEIGEFLNLDIKMETGTGKTYAYTKMIYELNKNYGIHKFIIVVPSLAIKLGTIKFINAFETVSHFKDQYDNKSIDLCILNAKKSNKQKDIFPSAVRSFVEQSELVKDRITVLITNMHLFKENSMLTKTYSSVVEDYDVPADALSATKPFIIIDEPHRVSKDNKTYKFILERIKPQCIVRFGATFPMIKEGKNNVKDYHNLIYNLGSCEAFNDNLVKGVSVRYIDSPTGINKKVKLLSLKDRKNARLELITDKGKKTFELELEDSLRSIDESFENIKIVGISKNSLILSNGQEISIGNEIYTDIYSTSYQKVMIQNALDSHFKVEKQNFKRKDKIKTLMLFFIDDIDSYRENKQNPVPTYLKDIFEELLIEKIKKELNLINENDESEKLYKDYLIETLNNIKDCHGGYFSKDNNDSDDAIAEEVEQILIKKEETLSIYKNNGKFNTFRFIFSKWTLKEGWDNPNIFTICKLRSSGSEISKLQEVGRGLRLPVNDSLSRVSNEQFYLNYIVDFTEKDFANKLIQEVNGEYSDNITLSDELLAKVAEKIGKTAKELLVELLMKDYIDIDKKILVDKRDEMFNEYPDLSVGLKMHKIINENNKKEIPKAKIRVDKFKEIKELWDLLNQKYFISYQDVIDDEILVGLLQILNSGIEGSSVISAHEKTLVSNNGIMQLSEESSKEYLMNSGYISYNVFLDKIYKSTNIPIKHIHRALVEYNKNKKISESFFNDNTLINFINRINEWKYNLLYGKFKYTSTKLAKEETALTDKDGNPKYEAEGTLGISYSEQKPSKDYLYDICLYDSELEKKNIITENDEVIVFGKIPARSIRIPLIGGGTYSPDFMYVVKRDNDVKEINLVIETKDYDTFDKIPSDQQFEINCAKEFFEKLQEDKYNVKYKVQLRNSQMLDILKNL